MKAAITLKNGKSGIAQVTKSYWRGFHHVFIIWEKSTKEELLNWETDIQSLTYLMG